ncbi:MAG: F0F1 ATP synthase subunit epsilon [Candidatus Omnitrophota bacterium]|nr:F0F1 ATP synthase subunit epsilon [Candidatus Omnitrophota bacterium]
MHKTFDLGIYTAEKTIFEGKVTSLVAPSEDGYLGILAMHAPLVAKLSFGRITFRVASGENRVIENNSTGFLQVGKDQVSILI